MDSRLRSTLKANKNRIDEINGMDFANLELCRVEEINPNKMKAKVELIKSGQVLLDIPFCLPARYLDRGILYIPEEGSLGVLGTTYKEESFILTFLSFMNKESINEKISPGEIMIQSKGYGFIKEDNAGNVSIGSPGNNYIVVSDEDDIIKISTTSKDITTATEKISGIINGKISEIEKIYDEKPSSILSLKEIVGDILKGEEVELTEPSPIITIEKGNVLNENGDNLKLEIHENPEEDYDMAYRVSVGEGCSIVIDKDGNVKINAKKIIIDSDEFEIH